MPLKAGDTVGLIAPSNSRFAINLSMSELLGDLLGGLGRPAMAGLVFGLTREKARIPLGVEAELDATAKTFTLLEAATTAS